jgi:hypothetical protein
MLMNRKGQAINDHLINLIYYVGWFILILIILGGFYMWLKSDSKTFSGEQNLKILAGRIAYAHEHQVDANVIISMPKNRLIVGFNPNEHSIAFAESKFWHNDYVINNPVLERPNECPGAKACICLFTIGFSRDAKTAGQSGTFSAETIACETVPGTIIVGTHAGFDVEVTGIDATIRLPEVQTTLGKTYPLAISSSHSVDNVLIKVKGDEILVQSSCSASDASAGEDCSQSSNACVRTYGETEGQEINDPVISNMDVCTGKTPGCYALAGDKWIVCNKGSKPWMCIQHRVTDAEAGTFREGRIACGDAVPSVARPQITTT